MSNRLAQLQQLLSETPNDSFLLFALAKAHEKNGADDRAKEFYLKLKSLDPDYVGLYYHLAKLEERQESHAEALAIYTEGMQIARKVGDQHAFSELQNAKMNLEAI